jgi:coenzyme PQQ precursor peptide PqqA
VLLRHGGGRHVAELIRLAREMQMRWEVPRAIDLRFGMEITLYIAIR